MQARLHNPWELESKTESSIIFSLNSVFIWGLWSSPPLKMVRGHVDNILYLYDDGAPYRHLVAILQWWSVIDNVISYVYHDDEVGRMDA